MRPGAELERIHHVERLVFTNEGTADRVIRAVLGVALLLFLPGPWNWIGVLPLLTGVLGFCPVYRLLGINTCPKPRSV